jgi:integrase
MSVNAAMDARPPSLTPPDPTPPTPKQAAALLTRAWEKDPDWGCLLWVAMTRGPRRGELCALRWYDVDVESALLTIARSYVAVGRRLIHKDTKTHQRRRIALSPESSAVLEAHHDRATARAALVGAELRPDALLFSPARLVDAAVARDGQPEVRPQMRAMGLDSHLHELRHYSATELRAAGVDLRTVAGRLGHGGGGATTLRVYAAWVPESDRRAASALTEHLPSAKPVGQ